MTTPPDTLTAALDALVAAARGAGLDADAARAEGEALAATVAERSRGAFVDWCRQTGREQGATEDFFAAAKRGNRYRVGPTPLLGALRVADPAGSASYADALADVATTAATLGTPSPEAAGVALGAGAAQRGGSPVPTAPSTPQQPVEPPVREPVPGLGDEILAGLEERSRGVLRMLRALDAPAGQAPLVTPGTSEQPPATTSHAGEPTQAAPTEPGAPATPDTPAEPPAPEPPARTVEELLAELDALVGLEDVKAEIHRQAAVLRIEGLRKDAGLTSPTITRHLVFNGNPGTGKTTVARLVAGIYRALGLLSKGQLVEVDRSELVAGFLGQTAMKTAEVVASAVGGVLFVDEAYALAQGTGDQYGQEAIDTLVKEMEDHRDDLVVIVAGYPLPMAVFISANPGLESRFRTTIDFPDYTDDELASIFEVMATAAEYDAGPAVLERLRELLGGVQRGPTFGNARYVRNLLEAAVGRHAWRLRDTPTPTLEQLRTLEAGDLDTPATSPDAAPPGTGPTEPVGWEPVAPTDQPSDAEAGEGFEEPPTGQAPTSTDGPDQEPT